MNLSDKRSFYDALKSICDLYGKPSPSEQMVALYFNSLNHISIDDFKAAINLHVRDTDQGQYFPKPADILRNIQGNKATQSEQAWSKVDKAIKSVGPHQTIVFDDGLIHAVIDDMGGWITLCAVSGEEYPFKHNEFIKRYQGFINKPPDNIPRKLIGIVEAHNSTEGHQVPQPLLIGDQEAARIVFETGADQRRIGITTMDAVADIAKQIKHEETESS